MQILQAVVPHGAAKHARVPLTLLLETNEAPQTVCELTLCRTRTFAQDPSYAWGQLFANSCPCGFQLGFGSLGIVPNGTSEYFDYSTTRTNAVEKIYANEKRCLFV